MARVNRQRKRTREIASIANPLMKSFRRALGEGVTHQGWVAVEGPLLLKEALAAAPAGRVHSVLVARSAEEKFADLIGKLPEEAEVVRVPDRLFGKIAETHTPQGIAALVELPPRDLDAVLGRPDVLLLVACEVQDPGNLGSMIRSALALGGTALITIEGTVSPFNPKAVRASAGAIFHLPVFPDRKPTLLFSRLRSARVRIIAADRESPSPLEQADLRGSIAFLIGKEATGLAPEIFREASIFLSIPIRPGVDSVNAGTAAGILLYEAARHRGFLY